MQQANRGPVQQERADPGIIADPYRCTDGTAHVLVYQGKERQLYRCQDCGEYISKSRLKRLTDSVEVQNA
jgi:uncharacterized Zn finger protein